MRYMHFIIFVVYQQLAFIEQLSGRSGW